jgi:hypothetical protein
MWTKAALSYFFFLDPASGCTGDHPQEELAKFGYRSERKVEQFKNHAIYIYIGTYCLNMTIPEIFLLKLW